MTEQEQEYEGDFVVVTTCETPTEAHLLKETLVAAGLPAQVADANFVQANPWMSSAVGGVRVLVPASLADEAKATLAAFNAGALQIDANHGSQEIGEQGGESSAGPGLRIFQMYRHEARKPNLVAVKQGFSWAAFIIGPLWFLLNGMWLTFLLSISFTWCAPLVIRSFGNGSASVQLLVVGAFFVGWVFTGVVANFLLGEELKRRGYSVGLLVRARSAGDAISVSRSAA